MTSFRIPGVDCPAKRSALTDDNDALLRPGDSGIDERTLQHDCVALLQVDNHRGVLTALRLVNGAGIGQIQLVKEGHVAGWDDPRMPTISGLRRWGYPAEAIRDFCSRLGVARVAATVLAFSLLDFSVRVVLNTKSPPAMALLAPI